MNGFIKIIITEYFEENVFVANHKIDRYWTDNKFSKRQTV